MLPKIFNASQCYDKYYRFSNVMVNIYIHKVSSCIFSYFSKKTYVVGTHQKCLGREYSLEAPH